MIRVTVQLPPKFKVAKQDVLDRAASALASYARSQIVKKAQANLSPTTAQNYIRGMQITPATGGSATISLTGKLPNMLEAGAPAWDIKVAMLKKATKHTADGEPYVDVPFKHGSPGTTRKQAMPTQVNDAMQDAIKQAKGLLRGPRNAGPGLVKESGVAHKTSIYSGMIKNKAGQHLTIRRISMQSSPGSWMYPEKKGYQFFKGVAEILEKIGPKLVQDYLKNNL